MSLTERQNNIGLPAPVGDAPLATPQFLHPPRASTATPERKSGVACFLSMHSSLQRENNLWRKTARGIIYRRWAEVAGSRSRGHDHPVIYHPTSPLLSAPLFLRLPCPLQVPPD